MKREKTTFVLECLRNILICIFTIVLTICLIRVTHTYCSPEQKDPDREFLEKELIRMQIRSFEWDEANRDFYR